LPEDSEVIFKDTTSELDSLVSHFP